MIDSNRRSVCAARPRRTASKASSRLYVGTISGMRSLKVPRRQPGFHVAIVAALGIGDGEQKTFGAVEKAGAQHIGAQERAEPVTDAGKKRDATAGSCDRLGAGRRIAVRPGE